MRVNRPIDHRPQRSGVRTSSCVVLLLLVLGACAGNPRAQGAGEGEATVRVENRAWTEMTMYALTGAQRVRLGVVAATSTAVLSIPSAVVGLGRSLTFVADPLGSDRTASSFEVFVRPGEEITLTIPPQVR